MTPVPKITSPGSILILFRNLKPKRPSNPYIAKLLINSTPKTHSFSQIQTKTQNQKPILEDPEPQNISILYYSTNHDPRTDKEHIKPLIQIIPRERERERKTIYS